MASTQYPGKAHGPRGQLGRFWQRVTEGVELNQLWGQFRADARTSYRLYSQEVDTTAEAGVPHGRHALRIAKQVFWAFMEKLTPARRVLLLLALVLLVLPTADWSWHTKSGSGEIDTSVTRLIGGVLMFALLMMEVGDRVVMKRDLQIAKEIQSWLLPAEPPQVPGLEIAFATRPANTVAGDYYDVFARPGSAEKKTWLIAIADVAGKSVPAAMLMATFQASLKTLSDTPGSLIELVSHMNRYACSNSQNGRRFTTAFIAEYEPAERRLTYVNAGHNNPVVLRKSGAVEWLGVGGMPLGILENTQYESATLTLEPGDWVAAFTDGVIEAENAAQQQYSEERLLVMLRWGAQLSPAMLLGAILQDIDRFVAQAPQHDDITCMLLKAGNSQ